MEASAIVAGTAKQEAAKTLIGWTLTRKAIEMYNVGYAVLAMPNIAKPVKYLPENIEQKMIKNDFEWAASVAFRPSSSGPWPILMALSQSFLP